MLVRNVFESDFLGIVEKSKEWGDLVIERETIYHVMCVHFRGTCFVAEDRGELIGYLLGFRSQALPDQAYMHLLQVAPSYRGLGVGQRLFSQFQQAAIAMGCKKITAVSRPQNKTGMAFYKRMGLRQETAANMIEVEGVQAIKDYNGPGKHMVLWSKEI
ncbi:GNAT family N-acetyltransferase [Methanocella arvoryzae]|uniref:Acetyltransferase (GNAT family) n=1 Tax=Methanocella arvoryzae (strain DSM 22066 / NBRC 105507 / MRE50) TaxID=351160 RepID=Q0W513_METAR|nr:GNAT family N-acetyltransferase [Methanocella arvoryzae]CAJ36530.1 putative acetyltransferase (GNAT family) [Methanocella arvoryzae MRE50]